MDTPSPLKQRGLVSGV
uniref:Uncharacterized protein n=1 Tax=Rhizophora mucronata TaxID=61149 RepID=A0A2P2QY59_RHIMU